MTLAYVYFVTSCCLSVGVGAYWFTVSVIKEIRQISHSINKKAHTNKNQLNEFKILFTEHIQSHAAINKLSKELIELNILQLVRIENIEMRAFFRVTNDFSDIFQPIIVSLFIWSLLAISGAMFMIQLEIVNYTLLLWTESLWPIFSNSHFVIDFSCTMAMLWLHCYRLSMGFLECWQCSLRVRLAKEWPMPSRQFVLVLIELIGTCYQSK